MELDKGVRDLAGLDVGPFLLRLDLDIPRDAVRGGLGAGVSMLVPDGVQRVGAIQSGRSNGRAPRIPIWHRIRVRRLFDLYARKRLGTRTIAQQLREEGVPAPSAGWGHPAVHWIINNPTYVGKIRWRDKVFEGIHEPLVDEFTFAKAQAILAERGEHAKRRGNASDFILSGLLRRRKCGKAYNRHERQRQRWPLPLRLLRSPEVRPETCDGERLPREKIETAVIHQLAALYRDEQVISDAFAKANAETENASTAAPRSCRHTG